MKFGIFYIGGMTHTDFKKTYDEFLEQAKFAEELGYDSIWLGEHHGSLYGTFPSPPVLAGAIAQVTTKLRIGISCSILPFQNPVRIAEEWAMVDVISGGRVDFGAGRGYQPREFAMMNANQEDSRAIFAESLDIILGLWNSDGPFTYHGKHFNFDNIEIFPKPIQKPIPAWIAAVSPSTFELAAERDLQVLTQPGLQTIDKIKEGIVDAARILIKHGRPPETIDFPMFTVVHLADTPEEAYESFSKPMAWFVDQLNRPGAHPGHGGKPPEGYEAYAVSSERMSEKPALDGAIEAGVALVTNPEGARERVRQLRDELGVKQFGCSFHKGNMTHEDVMAQMELWAKEVMPEFKGTKTPVPPAFVADADLVATGAES